MNRCLDRHIEFIMYSILGILDTAQNLPYECASICSFCSRMKRGRIYHTARREKYNVLALGQHLDDLAERYDRESPAVVGGICKRIHCKCNLYIQYSHTNIHLLRHSKAT